MPDVPFVKKKDIETVNNVTIHMLNMKVNVSNVLNVLPSKDTSVTTMKTYVKNVITPV
jgi:hypothetical protein